MDLERRFNELLTDAQEAQSLMGGEYVFAHTAKDMVEWIKENEKEKNKYREALERIASQIDDTPGPHGKAFCRECGTYWPDDHDTPDDECAYIIAKNALKQQ
jgi:rubrerythrin